MKFHVHPNLTLVLLNITDQLCKTVIYALIFKNVLTSNGPLVQCRVFPELERVGKPKKYIVTRETLQKIHVMNNGT